MGLPARRNDQPNLQRALQSAVPACEKPSSLGLLSLFSSFNLASRLVLGGRDDGKQRGRFRDLRALCDVLGCCTGDASEGKTAAAGFCDGFQGEGVHVPPEWHLDNRELSTGVTGNQSFFAGLNP